MTATAAPTTVTSTHDLLGLVRAASSAIDVYSDQLDALNVFPVPDGDTGKNLALTLRGIEEDLRRHPQTDFGDTVAFLAKTALMKGRGNSGVILSQLFRGFPAGIGDEQALTARGFAESLAVATELSYKAVPEPREGTMLTVYRECADVAKSFIESEGDDADLAQLLKCVADEAMRSVERSPELLEVLKRAGVIDAGGWGLAIIFESMQRHLDGVGAITDPKAPPWSGATVAFDESFVTEADEEAWGYCTVFVIEGEGMDPDAIRSEMDALGRSPIVDGDASIVKVHVHAEDPGVALTAGIKHGALSNIDINNMDVQTSEWADQRRSSAADGLDGADEHLGIGLLAVVSGDGMAAYFNRVAISPVTIVDGGDSQNPSVEDILNGIESVAANEVIVLPNNSNIIGAAEQAAEQSGKMAEVIHTKSMQAGVAAVGAFDPEVDMDDNVEEMNEMLDHLHVGDVFESVRDATLDDVTVRQGQYMVRVDGKALAASDDEVDLLVQGVMSSMHPGASVFVFYGSDQDEHRAAEAHARISEETSHYRRVSVDFIDGGQPHYNFLFSIE